MRLRNGSITKLNDRIVAMAPRFGRPVGADSPWIRQPANIVVVLIVLLFGSTIAVCVPREAHAASTTYLGGIEPVVSSAGFTHPGVFIGLPQLEAGRQRIADHDSPQADIYRWLAGTTNASLVERRPQWEVYSDARDLSRACDPESSHGCVLDVGHGGADGRTRTDDAKKNISTQINSTYANALLFYYSGGEERYAQNAVRMLNAYGETFRGFTSTKENRYVGSLLAAWMAETLVRAAEIIRYTYVPSAGQEAFDVGAFESMLREAFVPLLKSGTPNANNWRTSAIDGLMNVAVFLDDRALYDRSVAMWRDMTPSYIYLSSDGAHPKTVMKGSDASVDCAWINGFSRACSADPPRSPGLFYQNGQSQEICRDMWHASAGMGGIINAAETASLQGEDLYGEERERIMTGLSYIVQLSENVDSHGPPADFCADAACSGLVSASGNAFPTTWSASDPLPVVVAYNHYATINGLSFAEIGIPGYSTSYAHGDPVARFIRTHRSGPTDARTFVTAWQVLTHSGVGNGVTPSDLPRPSQTRTQTPIPTPPAAPADGTSPLLLTILPVIAVATAGGLWLAARRRSRS